MRSVSLLLVVVSVAVAGCAQPTPASKPDLAAEEQAIRAADARWLKAAQARDAAGEGSMFAEDGIAYREHSDPIQGPAAYQAFATKDYAENPKGMTSWSTDKISVAAAGDMAVQTGPFHNSGFGPQGDQDVHGRFVTVWKKMNGEWKVAQDIGLPMTPAEKKP